MAESGRPAGERDGADAGDTDAVGADPGGLAAVARPTTASGPTASGPTAAGPRRRRTLSLRWRIALVATAVVAVALVIGSLVFAAVLRGSLVDGVRLTAERDAAELVNQVETAGSSTLDDDADAGDDRFFQVLSTGGTVLASSPNAAGGIAVTLPQLRYTEVPLPSPTVVPTPSPSASDDSDDDNSGSGDSGSGDSGSGNDNSGSGDSGSGDSSSGSGGGSGSDDSGGSSDDNSSQGSGSGSDDADDSDDNSGQGSGSDDSGSPSEAPTPVATSESVVVDATESRTVRLSEGGGEFLAVARTADDADAPADAPADGKADGTAAGGGVWVLAGRSLATVDETMATVARLLAVAVPLLVVLVGLTSWFVVGRALSPVERMRRQVDEVTARNLDRRLADPGTNDEVGRLAHTMNRMLDRLDSSQRSQRRFISDASHELKSPLASLRQYAEVARAHPDRIGAAELSDAMLDEGARLERLVQGMLVLARADERSLAVPDVPVDLDDVVLAEVTRLRDSTELAIDASAVGPARVTGDEGLLAQLVRNLVDNAARHAHSAVALTLVDADGDVLLAVDDDGEGVPEAERGRIFERFVRLDAARSRDSGGSGLGLAIVREIATAHGGSVSVGESGLGGARFELRLPAASGDDAGS